MWITKIDNKAFLKWSFNIIWQIYIEVTSNIKNIFDRISSKKDQIAQFYNFVNQYKVINPKSKISIVDAENQKIIIDDKIYKILFSFTTNYIKKQKRIHIWTVPHKYNTISQVSDNTFLLNIEWDEDIVCNYVDWTFVKNIPETIKHYISIYPIIKEVNSQEDLESILLSDTKWLKEKWFFYLNSCFPRTMLMLDYCKTHKLSWHLIIDIYKTSKPWYNINDIVTHFALQIDDIGILQFVWDSDWWKYTIEDNYKFEEINKQSMEIHKISFEKITNDDNLIDILSMCGFSKEDVINWINIRINQLYKYHNRILAK